jgi:hypothetical protein
VDCVINAVLTTILIREGLMTVGALRQVIPSKSVQICAPRHPLKEGLWPKCHHAPKTWGPWNDGTIATLGARQGWRLRDRVWANGWCAQRPLRVYVLGQRGHQMGEIGQESLELPASSWWICRISIMLGFLGILIASL